MNIDTAVAIVGLLRDALANTDPTMNFSFELCSSGKALHSSFREELPALGALRRSGIYFITDLNEEILYIGKAASDNLAAEIWGKFSAPVIVNPAADIPRFEGSSLAKWSGDATVKELLISGNVLVFALIIEPAALCSLVEVFLQTHCKLGTDQSLPKLNKQIG